MSTFQISNNGSTVTTEARGATYMVHRMRGQYHVYCINASSRAYRRGFPVGRVFATLAEVEAAYKGLAGVSAAFA